VKPKQDCQLRTPSDFKMALEKLFSGDVMPSAPRVCEQTLFGRTDFLDTTGPTYPPTSLSKFGNMWVFVADEEVLNFYLDLVLVECANNCNNDPEQKKAVIKTMMRTVGVIDIDWYFTQEASDFEIKMVVVDQQKTASAWKLDPTWENIYNYLDTGLQVCNDYGCNNNGFPDGFPGYYTQDNISDFKDVTGCNYGYDPDSWSQFASCEDYDAKKRIILDYVKDNQKGGSVACLDGYLLGPDSNSQMPTGEDLTLWTRAFFDVCMAMSEWFTGNGRGYDPDPDAGGIRYKEWLVRGDRGLELVNLDAQYIRLWP